MAAQPVPAMELLKTMIIPILYEVTSDDVKLKKVVSNKGKSVGDTKYSEFCMEFLPQLLSKVNMASSSEEAVSDVCPAAAACIARDAMIVVGREFVVGYHIHLVILREVMLSLAASSLEVTDTKGRCIFKVNCHIFEMRSRCELLDASGKTLVTLQEKKVFSLHNRWRAFRGESVDENDLLFKVKSPSMFQLKTELHVFLGQRPYKNVCDYRIMGSCQERSTVVIYAGNTSNIVAQIHKKEIFQSTLIGKDHFDVTVYPNIDYAFIVALVVIFASIL